MISVSRVDDCDAENSVIDRAGFGLCPAVVAARVDRLGPSNVGVFGAVVG